VSANATFGLDLTYLRQCTENCIPRTDYASFSYCPGDSVTFATIDGTNLNSVTEVWFGSVRAPTFTHDAGNQITAQVPALGSDDSFLALDRNSNGNIDDGSELFGSYTAQTPSLRPNGFLALAEYDKPQNGGNGDGVISSADAVYSSLILWQDANHNGTSEAEEISLLRRSGITSISLRFRTSLRTDEYGNQFRYRAPSKSLQASEVGRTVWDVIFLTETSSRNSSSETQPRRVITESENYCF
jgi:hypothetical protein